MKELNSVSKKDYCRIERQNNICINLFCYENGLTYPVYVSDQKFHNSMDLLLISDENKSGYVYIKDFNRFMCNKTKTSEKVLIEHKDNCLIINGKQSVKLKSGSISFKNYFKQLPVPFKVYTDFECILKGVKVTKTMAHTQKNIKITFPALLLIMLDMLIINSVKTLFFTEEKMLFTDLLKQFLESMIIVKK